MEDNNILNTSIIKKIKEYFPLFIGVCYISGFVIVNSFFFKYKIYTASIFEYEYLSAGAIFILIFGLLLFAVLSINKSLDKTDKDPFNFFLTSSVRVLLLGFTYCFFIIDNSIADLKFIEIYNYGVLFIWFAFILLNNIVMPKFLYWTLACLIALGSNLFAFIVFTECRLLLLLTYSCGFYLIVGIEEFYEMMKDKTRNLLSILTFLSLSVIFGISIYDNIARRYGGGKPESITFIVDSLSEKKLPINLKISANHTLKAQLLHSSDKEYSIRQDSLLLTLDKNIFVGYFSTYK